MIYINFYELYNIKNIRPLIPSFHVCLLIMFLILYSQEILSFFFMCSKFSMNSLKFCVLFSFKTVYSLLKLIKTLIRKLLYCFHYALDLFADEYKVTANDKHYDYRLKSHRIKDKITTKCKGTTKYFNSRHFEIKNAVENLPSFSSNLTTIGNNLRIFWKNGKIRCIKLTCTPDAEIVNFTSNPNRYRFYETNMQELIRKTICEKSDKAIEKTFLCAQLFKTFCEDGVLQTFQPGFIQLDIASNLQEIKKGTKEYSLKSLEMTTTKESNETLCSNDSKHRIARLKNEDNTQKPISKKRKSKKASHKYLSSRTAPNVDFGNFAKERHRENDVSELYSKTKRTSKIRELYKEIGYDKNEFIHELPENEGPSVLYDSGLDQNGTNYDDAFAAPEAISIEKYVSINEEDPKSPKKETSYQVQEKLSQFFQEEMIHLLEMGEACTSRESQKTRKKNLKENIRKQRTTSTAIRDIAIKFLDDAKCETEDSTNLTNREGEAEKTLNTQPWKNLIENFISELQAEEEENNITEWSDIISVRNDEENQIYELPTCQLETNLLV